MKYLVVLVLVTAMVERGGGSGRDAGGNDNCGWDAGFDDHGDIPDHFLSQNSNFVLYLCCVLYFCGLCSWESETHETSI